jgi:hypothetical protein
VSEQDFAAWIEDAKKKYAARDLEPRSMIAAAQSTHR